jgi:hypothetical protein
MIDVPKGRDDLGIGEPQNGMFWRPLQKSDGSQTAWFRCPKGHLGMLSAHTIGADGTVTPSVVCPTEGCGFHEYIKLKDWTPPT